MHRMKRLVGGVAVLAVVSALVALPAFAADGPVRTFGQNVTIGFYKSKTVSYLDFGPVKLAAGNKVAPIWAFTNGAEGQRNIIDTVPGKKDYTPLWAVNLVTWNDGATSRVLRSAAAVRNAVSAGEASIEKPGVVVNCPVL
jgi:hypothetical protein